MKLSNRLRKQNIIFPLKSNGRSEAIQEMLDRLLKLNYLTATVKLHSFIDNKNTLINSAVGRGISYHYSTSIEIENQLAVLGISSDGIDYESPDEQKVHFILLILDTEKESNSHRKLVNRFQHFISESNFRMKIIDCVSVDEVAKLISTWEEKYLLNEDF